MIKEMISGSGKVSHFRLGEARDARDSLAIFQRLGRN